MENLGNLKKRSRENKSDVNERVQKKRRVDENCPICLDKIKKKVILNNCVHVFCFKCLENWATKSNECPICRTRFTKFEHKSNNKVNDDVEIVANSITVPNRNFHAPRELNLSVHPLFRLFDRIRNGQFMDNERYQRPVIQQRFMQRQQIQSQQIQQQQQLIDNIIIITDDEEDMVTVPLYQRINNEAIINRNQLATRAIRQRIQQLDDNEIDSRIERNGLQRQLIIKESLIRAIQRKMESNRRGITIQQLEREINDRSRNEFLEMRRKKKKAYDEMSLDILLSPVQPPPVQNSILQQPPV